MPRNDLILFLDLECTGADRDLDDIIEVGLALYSWPEFKEIASFTSIVTPSEAAWARMKDNEVVMNMHKKNGLFDEVDAMLDHDHSIGLPAQVDSLIDVWLSAVGTRNSPHIPLAGSGVSHYDRPYVIRSLPLLNQRLTYWAYDIGVLRRMFLLAGAKYPPQDTMTHRALDDARQHAEEFKFYMERITQMFGVLRAEADAAKEKTIDVSTQVSNPDGSDTARVGDDLSSSRVSQRDDTTGRSDYDTYTQRNIKNRADFEAALSTFDEPHTGDR